MSNPKFLMDSTEYSKRLSYYLGSDIARYGGDENAFVVLEMKEKNKCRIIHAAATERKSIPDTARRHIILDEKFKRFNRLFIDDNGVGGGVVDILVEELGKSRVVGINNSSKSVEKDARKKKILKEDLYSNALRMMEMGEIEIINHLPLMRSLKSMTFEYTQDRNIRIYGKYSHYAEAFVRACWAVKHKGLKLFIA